MPDRCVAVWQLTGVVLSCLLPLHSVCLSLVGSTAVYFHVIEAASHLLTLEKPHEEGGLTEAQQAYSYRK